MLIYIYKIGFVLQEVENHRVSESCDKLALALKQHETEIKRRDEEINDLQSKVRLKCHFLFFFFTISHFSCLFQVLFHVIMLYDLFQLAILEIRLSASEEVCNTLKQVSIFLRLDRLLANDNYYNTQFCYSGNTAKYN